MASWTGSECRGACSAGGCRRRTWITATEKDDDGDGDGGGSGGGGDVFGAKGAVLHGVFGDGKRALLFGRTLVIMMVW